MAKSAVPRKPRAANLKSAAQAAGLPEAVTGSDVPQTLHAFITSQDLHLFRKAQAAYNAAAAVLPEALTFNMIGAHIREIYGLSEFDQIDTRSGQINRIANPNAPE